MKNLTKLYLIITILSVAVMSVGIASASFEKMCLGQNQVVPFSLCASNIPNYICTSTSCQLCVDEISPGVYCPASLSSCTSGECTLLPETNTTNQTAKFNVTLVSPASGQIYNLTSSQTNKQVDFKYTVTFSQNITSCRLLVNNIVISQNTSKINSSINAISQSLLPGQYIWTISCIDKYNLTNSAPARTITIYSPNQITLPNVTLLSPTDNYTTNGSQTLSFQYSLSSITNITACNLYLNGSLSASNASAISSSTNSISKLLSPGNYSWYISCNHKSGNSTVSPTRKLTIISNTVPVVLPNVTLSSPLANQIINLTSSQLNTTVSFQYSLSSITNITACNLYLNNILTLTNSSKINTANVFSKLLSPGNYSWYISCPHASGSSAKSESRTFYINSYQTNSTNSTNQTNISQIILLTPDNNKAIEIDNSTNTTNQTFTFSFNNTNISKINQCSLIIGNQTILNQTLIGNNNSIYSILDVGNYSWKISCTNSTLGILNSELRNIFIYQKSNSTNQTDTNSTNTTEEPVRSGGGGGGGGGSRTIQNITNPIDLSQNDSSSDSGSSGIDNNLLNESSSSTNSTFLSSGITGAVVGTFKEMPYIPAIIFVIIVVGVYSLVIYRRKKLKK